MTFPASAEPFPDVQRALAVFAHPDDEVFCAGGTIARAADAGAEVMIVSATRLHGQASSAAKLIWADVELTICRTKARCLRDRSRRLCRILGRWRGSEKVKR